MKSMSELRKDSKEGLLQYLEELLKEQFKLRMKNSNNDFKNNALFGKVRRNIARVKYLLLNEHEVRI